MRNSERNFMVFVVVLVMCIGLALSVYFITSDVEQNTVARSRKTLETSAAGQASALKAVITGQMQALGIVSGSFLGEAVTLEGAQEELDDMLSQSSCLALKLITKEGTIYSSSDASKEMPSESAVKSAFSGVNAVQRSRRTSSGDQNVYFLAPFINDGVIEGAVIGEYDDESLLSLVSGDDSLDDYSLVVDSGGNIVIRSHAHTMLDKYTNLMNYLAKAVFEKGYSRGAILDDLSRGKGGSVRFSHSGENFMAAYAPLEASDIEGMDWYVLEIMDSAQMTREISANMMQSMLSVAIYASFSILALAAFIIYERMTNKRLVNDTNMVRIREERYKLVVAESGREVFQYDIPTKAVHRDNIVYDYFGDLKDAPNWIEFFESSSVSDEENTRLMREMFERIDAGVSPVTFDVKLRHPDGTHDWNRFHSNTIFTSDNRPQTAIVSYFNCTYLHEREAAYHKWLEEDKRLDREFVARFNWNITRNIMEESRYDAHPALKFDQTSVEKWVGDYAARCVCSDNRREYLRFFEIDRLLGAFEHGVDSQIIDYRESLNGGFCWIRLSAMLTRHPQSGDVKARLLYQNIDEIKRKELDIIAKSELDSLTGALNRDALMKKVAMLIAQNPSSTHAVFMIDVDGFKAVNDILGHDEGDEALKMIVGVMKGCLRNDDIIGRIGGDEIMVVLKDIPFDAVIKKKARQLCDALKMRVKDKVEISVSIGIALYPRDANGYEELYKRADVAMYKAKANGKDGYFFYNQFEVQQGAKLGFEEKCDEKSARDEALDACAIYAGDDDINLEIVKEAFHDSALVVSTDSVRRAIVAIRLNAEKRVFVVIDFAELEKTLEMITACHAESAMNRVAIIAAVGDEYEIERVMNAGASDYILRPINHKSLVRRAVACQIRLKRDISEHCAMYSRFLRDEEENHSLMMQATNSVLVIYDYANDMFIYNPSIERMLYGTYDKRSLWRILLGDMVARSTDVKKMQALVSGLANNPDTQRAEMNVTLKTAASERHCFRFMAIRAKEGEQGEQKMLLVFTDINDTVEKSDKLVFKAERDLLTGLYNADTFFEKCAGLLKAKPDGYYYMLAIDMDNFKSINNQFGRSEGNRVLCGLCEKLARAAHLSGGIVSRISADNFAALCPWMNISAFESAINECSRGIERYCDYYSTSLHAGRYRVSEQSMSVNDAYDRAMIAKSSIKYRYDVHIADFSDSMLEKLIKEQSIVSDMELALEEGQFEVWYQPQYSISSKEIIGAEALVRWRRPNHGIVPPKEYIPLFESNGFIYRLDQFVWKCVADSLAKRAREGKNVVPVSVNVSRWDICQPDFFEVITGITRERGVDNKMMRLEISESAMSNLSPNSVSTIFKLRQTGFEIFIDDFASGYSSLGMLKEVATDALKLSCSLLYSVEESERADMIIRSVINMAGMLNLPVIAEGVERQEQIEYLKSVGCGYVQGFVYSKPMTGQDFEGLIGLE